MKPKLFISSFGIHSGGGAVLLKSLLESLSHRINFLMLDSRLAGLHLTINKNLVGIVPKSFFFRIRAINTLSKMCGHLDTLLCFNSLPPLIKVKGRVIVYVHAPHFVGMHQGISYNFISRVRFIIERLWFKAGAKYVSEFWVQTESMESALKRIFPNAQVKVMPFVDGWIVDHLNNSDRDSTSADSKINNFFYPADGVGHKNHINLLKAWEILAVRLDSGCPNLVLTLDNDVFEFFIQKSKISAAKCHITNLGFLPRENVLEVLTNSTALIFPSKAETFGLPLIEATAVKKPIIASELDFVRDVCSPIQSFDPNSPKSIARAVERYLGLGSRKFKVLSANEIACRIIEN